MRGFFNWIKLIWTQWRALKAQARIEQKARLDALHLDWDKLDQDVKAPSSQAPADELQDRFRRTDF